MFTAWGVAGFLEPWVAGRLYDLQSSYTLALLLAGVAALLSAGFAFRFPSLIAMRFVVEPEIFLLFPGIRLAIAVAGGLDNRSAPPALDAQWCAAWQASGALELPNAQSHPHVQAWREHFRALGMSAKKFPTSIESMLRRAMKAQGSEPFRINPLVDFYNTLSLRHVAPAGAFDMDRLDAELQLRRTRHGDRFTALDETESIEVAPGEIAYACGSVVLTRHFMWRQAREALVLAESRNVFLVSEIPGVADDALAARMAADMATGLRDHFGVVARTTVLNAEHLEFELEAD